MGRIAIKSEREYIREVFRKLKNKEYAVPVFQRDFVWTEKQVIDLFDSISKGYPIGSLVLWESSDIKRSKNILTDDVIEMPTPKYYILDGRQRLTSLYGCFSSDFQKKDIFKLFYNLEAQIFEYPKKKEIFHIPVSDLYDTLSLLNALEKLKEHISNPSIFSLYLYRAKMMNSIFQEYVIGEVLISDCTLEEASVVFNRINSKGTFINKIDMLQALSYKNDNDEILQDKLSAIKRRLEPYGFQNIESIDILNSCFWVKNKKYYDSKISELNKYNLDEIMPEISDCLVSSVAFLRHKCYVLSYELIPYRSQLLALIWFFLKHKKPNEIQSKELQRWFFYTSVCNTFQNGSLTNVRRVHNRFELFLNGESSTAYDYQPLELPNFEIAHSRASASTKLLVAIHLYHYMHSSGHSITPVYLGLYKPFGNIPIGNVPKFTQADASLMSKIKQSINCDLYRYGLSDYGIKAIQNGDSKSYLYDRHMFIDFVFHKLFDELEIQLINPQ